jgi:hypothetical protein
MAWPRLLDRIADRHERVPTALIMYGFEPMELGKPARNLWSRPQTAVVRWRLDPFLEPSQCLGREDRRLRSVVDALIT